MALSNVLGAFGSVAGGISTYARLDRESKELSVASGLKKRAIRKANRQAVGSYVSDVGASGVELTLDQIADRTKEAELDVAVIEDHTSRQKKWNKIAGMSAIGEGIYGAAMELSGGDGSNLKEDKEPSGQTSTTTPSNPYQHSGLWGKKNPFEGLK